MRTKCMTMLTSLVVAASISTSAAHADGVLNIFNFGDYTSPELIKKFSEQYNVKVTITDYDSNDTALTKVRQGSSGFDIVVPSANFMPIWIAEGLLLESRPDQMPNFKYLDERWVNVPWDPGRHYSVPWVWGIAGPLVNTTVYKGDINTTAIWLDPPPELVGKVNVTPEMNDVLYAAIRYIGGEWCSIDKDMLRKLRDKLKEAKKKWISMDYEVVVKMPAGDYAASYYYNGASFRIAQQNPAVKFGFQKEGYLIFMDSVAILKEAKNVENAKAFQNFIMAPENAALISNFANYANGIKGSDKYMDPKLVASTELNPPEEFKAAGGWQTTCSPEVNEVYSRIWADILK